MKKGFLATMMAAAGLYKEPRFRSFGNKYMPHQGEQEKARRVSQVQNGILKVGAK